MKRRKLFFILFAVAAIALANMHFSVNENNKSELNITAFQNAEADGCSECFYPFKCSNNQCIYPLEEVQSQYYWAAECVCGGQIRTYCPYVNIYCAFDYNNGDQYCVEEEYVSVVPECVITGP